MTTNFRIDSLDKRILSLLTANARMPYLEVARQCRVSGAAIHQRIQKMQQAGVIEGSAIVISPKGLGYQSCAFIGLQINLSASRTHQQVYDKIKTISEIVECHHTTGKYSLLIKIHAKSNEHLKKIITEEIQSIPEISGTETFISLEEGFIRQLPVE